MSSSASSSLTSTLVLALAQSEALQRQIGHAQKLIDQLKLENEQLRQEVQGLRQAQAQLQTPHPDLTIQLDQLFRKDAEKQAEIDSLRKRLAQPSHARTPNASSPALSGDDQPPLNASRKRARINSPGDRPLRDIDANSPPGGRPQQLRKSKGMFRDRTTEAISLIAEDGVDCHSDDVRPKTRTPIDPGSSPNQRLQGLLAAPSAAAPVAKDTPRPRSSKKTPIQGRRAENNEPLRRRPLNGLNLSHFKVNPKYASGLDFPFREVVREKEARKCLPGCNRAECCGASFKALAMTLPPDPKLSENDLLLEFLGPGSEQKISSLTPLARTNLVHEARAKRLANAYGKMHRATFEPPSSPPAFWNVDIPSTQEQEEIRGPAMAKQREEVENRYQEALKGGRWLFADE
ncbi:hypothetical protein G647_03440 [Cladophialophora carrionii CBS 160.54]|uniref:DNA endonuclease activator Ctp1 C-terminal domain-containing protein n=1 Tax=Cladophialophora carrionii CBS 160.54 TaxID=1279043 RepID=V9DBK7_9EURO|nr:uncharacterized protein G647_03440 [Cladophialophora carrionii CBS 160.54]ETI24071.1 hypothetical protein G647_03440 [Cladophialophora carrionii CBS 160.54]